MEAKDYITFLPGNKFINVSGGYMQIYNIKTGEYLQESRLKLPDFFVIIFSSDGKLIAAGLLNGRIIFLAASANRTRKND